LLKANLITSLHFLRLQVMPSVNLCGTGKKKQTKKLKHTQLSTSVLHKWI
jgi:hypothetical protein